MKHVPEMNTTLSLTQSGMHVLTQLHCYCTVGPITLHCSHPSKKKDTKSRVHSDYMTKLGTQVKAKRC